MSALTNILPAPTGIVARYVGSTGGSTTRYYWVQAIYASGYSPLGQSNALASTLANLDRNNQVYVEWNPMAGAIGYLVFYTTSSTAPTQGSILVGTVTAPNFTDVGQSNSGNLGTSQVVVGGSIQVAKAQYSFATDGGAISTITPALSDTIPNNAIIVGATIDVTSAVTSTGTTGFSVGTSAGSSTTSILASTVKGSLTTGAILNGVPVFATPVKMTAAGQITVTIITTALNGGIVEIFVYYVVSINA